MKLTNKALVILALFTSVLTTSCGSYEQENVASLSSEYLADLPHPSDSCNLDVKTICRAAGHRTYIKYDVSRVGDECEFQSFSDEVHMDFCDASSDSAE